MNIIKLLEEYNFTKNLIDSLQIRIDYMLKILANIETEAIGYIPETENNSKSLISRPTESQAINLDKNTIKYRNTIIKDLRKFKDLKAQKELEIAQIDNAFKDLTRIESYILKSRVMYKTSINVIVINMQQNKEFRYISLWSRPTVTKIYKNALIKFENALIKREKIINKTDIIFNEF